MAESHRLQLLPVDEINLLYALPEFSSTEQIAFFMLSEEEERMLASYTKVKTKIYFLLQLGYFKANFQFYNFRFEDVTVASDIKYLLDAYSIGKKTFLQGKIHNASIQNQRQKILKLFNYNSWNKASKQLVKEKLGQLMRIHPKHQDMFRELLIFFNTRKIVIPSYRVFQELFSKAISCEKKRLSDLMASLPKTIGKSLDDILSKEDSISQLSLLKKDQKNFQLTALRGEIDKCNKIKELYQLSKIFIPKLELSRNCIKYYCEFTEQTTIYRLRKFTKTYSRLHLLCYIYYRYEQIVDHLIITFQYHVKKLVQAGEEYTDQEESKYNTDRNFNLPNVSRLLRWMISDKIELSDSYADVLKQAFCILPRTQFIPMADFIENKKFDREAAKWEFYGKASRKIAIYLRSIIVNIELSHVYQKGLLMQAINFIKQHYQAGRSPSELNPPVDMIKQIVPRNKQAKLYRTENGVLILDPVRFEFFIYLEILEEMDNGILFCNESVSYKNLKNDLVSDNVMKNKEDIINTLGYPRILSFCDTRLKELDQELHDAWFRTNSNIAGGKNKAIKIQELDGKITWSLPYKGIDRDEDGSVFDRLAQVEIADVMRFFSNQCHFWKAFTHIKPYKAKQKSEEDLLLACILADAFGCGIYKMSGICDLDFSELRYTRSNFIRIETLKKASDRAVNFISKLPIFKRWNIVPEKLLADADGQKGETKLDTIQSRHSRKYFGLKKGIANKSLVANYLPINSRVISPNEHESHFTFDLFYNNTSDVMPDMITGDMHSVNQLNFLIFDCIGVEFVPNYKDIVGKSSSIYCIRNPKQYKGLIVPIGQINLELIKEQKDEIQRVLLSLVMQETTQSIIVRKLSSHKRYGRLKKALWEYNKILSSIHLLNLIDNSILRNYLKRARNRTEAYHQLQGHIRKIHGSKFTGRTIIENEIWNQASRLVALCMIGYNANILDELSKQDSQNMDIISKVSPIAWQHINCAGRYNFTTDRKPPNIKEIIGSFRILIKKFKK